MMTDEETWDPPQPTAADLRHLERIADERDALKGSGHPAIHPADRQDAALRRHLLSTLDRMEEALCVHGHRMAEGELAAGWQVLAGWEERLGAGGASASAAASGRCRKRRRRRRTARPAAAGRKTAKATPRRAS